MLISKKRIRSIATYSKGLVINKPVIICVNTKHIDLGCAVAIGFGSTLEFGETVLPTASLYL